MSSEKQPAGILSGVGSFLGISSSKNKYVVRVKTRDVKFAGTNNTVRCAFYAENNKKRTSDFLLDKTFVNDLEQGEEDVFEFSENDIGNLDAMEIWMDSDSDSGDKWFCEYIIVSYVKGDNKNPKTYPFPLHRWIKANKRYEFELFDCTLPQDVLSEKQRQQRKEEIQENRIAYKFKEDSEGLPRTTETLPEREVFSFGYQFDLVLRVAKLKLNTIFQGVFGSDKWENFDDMKALFKGTFNLPRGWFQWKSDFKFGDQRLNGANTNQIQICKEIPPNFPVTDDMVASFLDGLTLTEAAEQKRLYIVDHQDLEGCPQKEDAAQMCCPLGLFFVNNEGELIPIAIQLFQRKSEDNPIFVPSDPEYKWMLAKMFFNNADGQVHQSVTHLACTHLACESIGTALTQALSPSHPVYQLMAPHFLYVYAINHAAVGALMAPGAFFSTSMSIGHIGLKEIIRRKWSKWRMDREGWYPADIELRGVDDKEALPNYYCRDDQLALHDAIWDYVRDVIAEVYDRPQRLKEDWEIQEFARLLVDKDGCGINGVFGGGKFEDVEDLVKVVTATIFLASVTHAGTNFPQYDEYGFAPVYPALLFGDVPKDKSPITLEDIISYLPNKSQTLNIMLFNRILSERGTQPLGHFEIEYMYRPSSRVAVKRFQEKMKEIGDSIDARNKQVKNPYPYLHPKDIPNAISI